MSEQRKTVVECAIALVWPEGRATPVCEMFRVDRQTMRWSSKHYSGGASFVDGGRLYNGETAWSLAVTGTGSAVYRYPQAHSVTFVVASLDESLFESTHPTDWTVERLRRLRDAEVSVISR